ncbi:Hypp3448 [Branchiostoma lanceolatum]|uniref:Hypp3448 protein n=1 Tax=Branchiostoma lanceolatum TaxID=7740 RepID=A0A8K0EXW5_BRALA|nr:Hypp3448 [Branchiostoma lanceolatum]
MTTIIGAASHRYLYAKHRNVVKSPSVSHQPPTSPSDRLLIATVTPSIGKYRKVTVPVAAGVRADHRSGSSSKPFRQELKHRKVSLPAAAGLRQEQRKVALLAVARFQPHHVSGFTSLPLPKHWKVSVNDSRRCPTRTGTGTRITSVRLRQALNHRKVSLAAGSRRSLTRTAESPRAVSCPLSTRSWERLHIATDMPSIEKYRKVSVPVAEVLRAEHPKMSFREPVSTRSWERLYIATDMPSIEKYRKVSVLVGAGTGLRADHRSGFPSLPSSERLLIAAVTPSIETSESLPTGSRRSPTKTAESLRAGSRRSPSRSSERLPIATVSPSIETSESLPTGSLSSPTRLSVLRQLGPIWQVRLAEDHDHCIYNRWDPSWRRKQNLVHEKLHGEEHSRSQ